MFKRLIALLLACMLMTGTLCAFAEPEGISIDGEATSGDIDAVIDAGDLSPLIGDLETALLANDGDGEDELLPTELIIKKSATKKVILGLDYQVRIPGKTIKRCTSSNKKIATVTNKGLIHTKKAGEVKITGFSSMLVPVDDHTLLGIGYETVDTGSDMEMQTGLKTISNAKYFFDDSGKMHQGWKTIKGKKCYFDSKGILKIGKHG